MRIPKIGLISAGSTLRMGHSIHAGRTILLDQLAGSVVTLPPAVGSGNRFKFVEKIAATSNSHIIKVQNGTDVMVGSMVIAATTSGTFPTVAASDTITLNRTTSGGATNGANIILEDVAPGIWAVSGTANGSGSATTPFSATVS